MFNNDVRLRALQDARRDAGADRAEEGDPLFQRRHAAQRPGQPGRAARGDQRRRPRPRRRSIPIDTRGLQAVVPGGDARQASGRGQALFSGPRRAAAVLAARRVAGHADVARRRHRRPRLHRHATTSARRSRACSATCPRTTCSATAARTRRRTAASAASRCASSATACASRRAPATTPTATSRTPTAAIAKRSCRSSSSPPSRRPTCRCSSPAASSGSRRTATTCRSRWPSPAPRCPVADGKDKVSLDVLGMVRDEQGRPVGRIRETMKLPPGTGDDARRQAGALSVGVTLPPGRFSVKVVVRENTTGAIGLVRGAGRRSGAEAGAGEGQLGRAEHAAAAAGVEGPIGQPAGARRRAARAEPDPRRRARPEAVLLLRGLRAGAGRRRSRRAHEPGVLSRQGQGVRDAGRRARRRSTHPTARPRCSSSKCPREAFTPGLYTCQVNIIDAAAGKFAFPRLAMLVR